MKNIYDRAISNLLNTCALKILPAGLGLCASAGNPGADAHTENFSHRQRPPPGEGILPKTKPPTSTSP
jgi:hypothetical protein